MRASGFVLKGGSKGSPGEHGVMETGGDGGEWIHIEGGRFRAICRGTWGKGWIEDFRFWEILQG